MFKTIEGSFVVLCSRGLYKQVAIAQRGQELYAKLGSGYARLMHSQHTSLDNTKWIELSLPDGYEYDGKGPGSLKLTKEPTPVSRWANS